MQAPCQCLDFITKLVELIPKKIPPSRQKSPADFTRKRKLPFPKLVVFLLHIVSCGRGRGVDIKAGEFFKGAARGGIWHEVEPFHRSSLTRAREKAPWQVFRDIFHGAADLAREFWAEPGAHAWNGMSVYAIDGSKIDLPATGEIREFFDPGSGLASPGRGHYPQCLLTIVYDVFRRLPVAASVVGIPDSDERAQAGALIARIPPGNALLFDRGYPSYEFIKFLDDNYRGSYVFRCPASHTFPAVEEFARSGGEDGVVWVDPSGEFSRRAKARGAGAAPPIKLRAVKLRAPDGKVSVLLTNLFDEEKFPEKDVVALYFRRWEVESCYRDEKAVLEVEKFHAKTVNGVLQEIYALLAMMVIARTLMQLSTGPTAGDQVEPQFKNAIMALASDAAALAPDDPEKAAQIFREILDTIRRVKYYRPKSRRPSQPRVCKKPPNKWSRDRREKTASP